MNYKQLVLWFLKKHRNIEFHPHAKTQAKARNISTDYVRNMLEKNAI